MMQRPLLLQRHRLPGISWLALLVVFHVLVTVAYLHDYLPWKSPVFLMGLLSLVFVIPVDKERRGSQRFGYMALLHFLLAFVLPVKTMLFFGLAFSLLFVIESLYGKTSMLALFIIMLVSPASRFFSDLLTFQLRLRLTAYAGRMLQLAGTPCNVSGNLITLNGTGFSVDPACMGLNMMITSLLTGAILLAFYQRRYQLQLKAWKVLLVLGCITCLNVFSNLARIIALVQFNIMPENIMHDITGMACFILYVMLPGLPACKWTVQHWGEAKNGQEHRPLSPRRLVKTPLLQGLVIISMLFAVYGFQEGKTPEAPVLPGVKGYKVKALEDGVIKLENKSALVYVKRIENFYRSGHNPLICWEGSGYLFRQVRKDELFGIKMYTGILQNGKDQLYTAWWFDNGRQITIDQLTWRWHMLQGGDRYSIVNVTASSREKMESEVRLILQTRRLKHLL